MQPSTTFQNAALLGLRFAIAAVFLFAGVMKWAFWSATPESMSMSPGTMWNILKFLSIVEPIGAVALIAGFLTRSASAGLAIIMVGAIAVMRADYSTAFFTMPQAPGLDYNTLLLAGCIVLMAFGAGDWSVDALWKEKNTL